MKKLPEEAFRIYKQYKMHKIPRLKVEEASRLEIELGCQNKRRRFLDLLRENQESGLFVSALQPEFEGKVSEIDIDGLSEFVKRNEENVDALGLSSFLNYYSTFYCKNQYAVVRWIMSFDFEFTLTDLNAFFKDLELSCVGEVLSKDLRLIDSSEMVRHIRDLNYEYIQKPDPLFMDESSLPAVSKESKLLKNSTNTKSFDTKLNASKNSITKKQKSKVHRFMRDLVFKVVVLTYKCLRRKNAISRVSEVLNKMESIRFNANFWSSNLLITLLYNYSDFELKFKITELLSKSVTLPLVLYSLSEGRETNPFVEFTLSDQIGVCSFCLESASRKKLGKTQLLNSTLLTRFETNNNDPFGNVRVDLDSGFGFDPDRKVCVVDCNFHDARAFEAFAEMTNVALLHVCFTDLVDKLDRVKEQLAEMKEICREKRVYLIVIVRDWKDYVLYLEEDLIRQSDNGREDDQSEDSGQDTESENELLIKKIKDYGHSDSDDSTYSEYIRDLRKSKVKQGTKAFHKIKRQMESEFFEICYVKNLKHESDNQEEIGKLQAIIFK